MRTILTALLLIPSLCIAASAKDNRNDDARNFDAVKKHSQRITDGEERALDHLARGDAHLERSELEQAISAYNEALILDNSLDIVFLHRAMALGYNEQYEKSIRDLDEYIERNPKSSIAYTKRGLFCLRNNDIYQAVKSLQRAIELDKNNAEAYDDLGVIYIQAGKVGKAVTYFRAATTIDPDYAKAWHNRAMASLLLEEYDTALSQVDRALQLQSRNSQTLMLKSIILEQLGEPEKARHFEALANGK